MLDPSELTAPDPWQAMALAIDLKHSARRVVFLRRLFTQFPILCAFSSLLVWRRF